MKTPAAVLPELVLENDLRYRLERFTPAQAAGYLHIAIDRVYRYAAGGQIGHVKDGRRRIRFSQADLDLWRQARRVEPRDAATVKVRQARLRGSSLLPPTNSHERFDPDRSRDRRTA